MLRVEADGPVLRVTMNRPEVRNAFGDVQIAALSEVFSNVPEGTRVVVLAGEGKAFCAGGDLEWMRRSFDYNEEENYQDALNLAHLFQAIARCPAPVIARVQGAAFGGGSGLVAASDYAVAAEGTKFSFSEIRLGLVPGTISLLVMDKIGHGHARALFATGEVFDAQRALQIGLVHAVCPEEDLDQQVEARIKMVLSAGPQAVAKAKLLPLDPPASPEESARRLARVRAGAEAREGVAAFLEKRKASFVVER